VLVCLTSGCFTPMTSSTDLASTDLAIGQCQASDLVMPLLLGFLGLVLVFFGYRIYRCCIGLLGFALFFCANYQLGTMTWSAGRVGQWPQDVKTNEEIMTVVCALGWGIIGALLTVRFVERIQRLMGFIVGAMLGVLTTAGMVTLFHDVVDARLGDRYAGWPTYVGATAALPAALALGYLLRESVVWAIMLASAVGGAELFRRGLTAGLRCFEEVKLQQSTSLLCALLLAGMGFLVQFFTTRDKLPCQLPRARV